MKTRTKYVIGGAAAVVLAWWILPNWLAMVLLAALVVVPVAGYLMLDPSQRRRLGRIGRKQLNR